MLQKCGNDTWYLICNLNLMKEAKKKNITINHMYSQSLNMYGDLGNIIALQYRAGLREIGVKVVHTELNEEFIPADIYLIGGGQDKDQMYVYRDLLKQKKTIQEEVEKGKVFLLICGGYQLFGKSFIDGEGNLIEGLEILDIDTAALDTSVASRCIGNAVVKIRGKFAEEWGINLSFSEYLVGFENHGGQTRFLSDSVQPIGDVITGFGNNSFDKIEGASYQNIIGTYLHGSILPKNPHLTDAILQKALHFHDKDFTLPEADWHLEQLAHQSVVGK